MDCAVVGKQFTLEFGSKSWWGVESIDTGVQEVGNIAGPQVDVPACVISGTLQRQSHPTHPLIHPWQFL